MKLLLLSLLLITFTSCSTLQVEQTGENENNQTFTEYVILNKYSNYEGKGKKDWDNQPSENFPGIRFINWLNKNKQ